MDLELSIVMPCLNESETIATCINKAKGFLLENNIKGEIIIADNGSSDKSDQIAIKEGCLLVRVEEKGYGASLIGGINKAHGKYIIMGDSDDSYDFSNLMPLLSKLRDGFDLVMGNRFKGGIKKGAMPFLHKYLGNPILSFLGRLFFKSSIGDFHCGLRGFTFNAYKSMNLHTTGMEFASEMVIKANLLKLKVTEVPVILFLDGRTRKPHLRTWHDGWRHLRFLLIYSPKWLFLYPSIFFIILGSVLTFILSIKPILIHNVTFDVTSLLFSSSLIVISIQFIFFYMFSKVFAIKSGLLPKDEKFNALFKFFNLEKGLIIGGVTFFSGIILLFFTFFQWYSANFGALNPSVTLRYGIPGTTLLFLGIQIIIYSFFLSILGLKRDNEED